MTDNENTLARFYSHYRNRDWTALAGLTSPDAVWRQAASLPWAGEWRGLDGFAAMLKKIDESLALTVVSTRLSPHSAGVLVEVDATFTARPTGREIAMRVLELYRVENGQVFGADAFYFDTHAIVELHEGTESR
ncbi:nuclear transport factor 2 family protein [Amycolatopsis sp. GM8]|uniref:nuclear transport factor 2 family protein n=1 Tax=Amycolatopsis sp. GM8 TaxID=2896530 RepID=UPI001F18BECA|nr:nuclear transport factor 2 family protein [Amycolatopsis sp. GM8]